MSANAKPSFLDLARAAAKLAGAAARQAGAVAKDAVPLANDAKAQLEAQAREVSGKTLAAIQGAANRPQKENDAGANLSPASTVSGDNAATGADGGNPALAGSGSTLVSRASRTAAQIAQSSRAFATEVSERLTEERLQREKFLRSRGLWPRESEIEGRMKVSYHGGHPEVVAAIDDGELLITRTRLVWCRGSDAFAIDYNEISGLELDHYNASALRNMLLGSSRSHTVRNRVIIECLIAGAPQEVRFEFRDALTIAGNETVARKFLAFMAPHRSAFARPAAPVAVSQLASVAAPVSTADELAKFADLYAKGLLTDEEFKVVKARLLGF